VLWNEPRWIRVDDGMFRRVVADDAGLPQIDNIGGGGSDAAGSRNFPSFVNGSAAERPSISNAVDALRAQSNRAGCSNGLRSASSRGTPLAGR